MTRQEIQTVLRHKLQRFDPVFHWLPDEHGHDGVVVAMTLNLAVPVHKEDERAKEYIHNALQCLKYELETMADSL